MLICPSEDSERSSLSIQQGLRTVNCLLPCVNWAYFSNLSFVLKICCLLRKVFKYFNTSLLIRSDFVHVRVKRSRASPEIVVVVVVVVYLFILFCFVLTYTRVHG